MNKLIKIITFACCLFFAITMQAQVLVSGKITGQVTGDNNQPLAFATIKVQSTDSLKQIVAEKIADENGYYEINIPEPNTYLFTISATGFITKREEKAIDAAMEKLDFNLLENKEDLKEVTVSSSAAVIQRKSDRIVMQVENNPVASGKSSLEMLNLAPGVLVYNDVISLNGNSGIRIMIDGKLLNLSGSELIGYLNALRSEDIKSVEVIAHPPAEYEAQGTGGLINIVLKKNRNTGLNGNIYSNYTQGRYPGTSNGATINFKRNKWSMYGSGSYNRSKQFQILTQYRMLPGTQEFRAENQGVSYNEGDREQAGVTFDINEKQFINLEYNRSTSVYDPIMKSNTQTTFANDNSQNTKTLGTFLDKHRRSYNNAALKYQLTTDSLQSKFTLLADYTRSTLKNKNQASSSLYNAQNERIQDTLFGNSSPGNATIYTADANYVKVIKGEHKFTIGSKVTSTRIENKALFEYYDNDSWHQDPTQNYTYDYDENILAGYVKYEGTLLKTNIQLGLRGENTDVKGLLTQLDTKTKNPNSYFGLFPSIYLSRSVNKSGDNQLHLSYNRRLNRPSFHNLNPYVSYIDAYSVGMGNPFLKPEYNHSYELGFLLKNTYMFTLNYTHEKDVINGIIRADESNPEVMIQQPLNSGNGDQLNLTIFAPVKITKWWTSQNTLQVIYSKLVAPQYKIEKPIGMLQTNHTFNVDKKTNFTLSAFYLSNYIFSNGILDPFGSVSAGFNRKFFNDKLTLKMNINDIFYTSGVRGNVGYNNFNLAFKQKQQSRTFTIGLSYNFTSGKAFRVKKLESSSAEEQKRLNKEN